MDHYIYDLHWQGIREDYDSVATYHALILETVCALGTIEVDEDLLEAQTAIYGLYLGILGKLANAYVTEQPALRSVE